MKYFAGFLIEGEVARWHIETSRDISEKFDTRKIHERVPPHVTLYYFGEVGDLLPIKKVIGEWVKRQKDFGEFHMNGFGRFGEETIFADFSIQTRAKEAIEELRENMRLIPGVRDDGKLTWHPHASLARSLNNPKSNQVWKHVLSLPKPDFKLRFDRVFLFRLNNDEYVVEEEFKLKS